MSTDKMFGEQTGGQAAQKVKHEVAAYVRIPTATPSRSDAGPVLADQMISMRTRRAWLNKPRHLAGTQNDTMTKRILLHGTYLLDAIQGRKTIPLKRGKTPPLLGVPL